MSKLALVASAISSIINSPVKTYDECVANGLTINPKQILDLDSFYKKSLIHIKFKDSDPITSPNIVKQTDYSHDIVEQIQIFIKPLVGDSQSMVIDPNITVLDFKATIHAKFGTDIKTMRLVFADKQLEDHRTLKSYKVKKGCTIQILSRILGGVDFHVIRQDLLDPQYDYDFTNLINNGRILVRGNEIYKQPYGWERIALNVRKYGPDQRWLGRVGDSPDEWAISYHGTNREAADSIANEGYLLSRGVRFLYGRGIYSSPEINEAERYSKIPFEHNGTRYKVVIQNRVNPEGLTKYRSNTYWLTPREENMRPYGLCVKIAS